MSEWTHAICVNCWRGMEPNRQPVTIAIPSRVQERCCWCGDTTDAGIYRREDPAVLMCGHDEED